MAENRSTVMVMKSHGAEQLSEAIQSGMLNAIVEKRVEEVLHENDALRRENSYLRGLIEAKDNTLNVFRSMQLSAMNYKTDKQTGLRWEVGALIGVASMALTLLTCVIAMY